MRIINAFKIKDKIYVVFEYNCNIHIMPEKEFYVTMYKKRIDNENEEGGLNKS